MAECQRYRGKFSEHIDGVLDPQERRALEEHLAGCAACRRELAAWRRLVADVADLPEPDAPEGFAGRVLERLEGVRPAAPSVVVSLLWYRALPIAAMVLVVLGLTFAVNRPSLGRARPERSRLAMARTEPAWAADEAEKKEIGASIEAPVAASERTLLEADVSDAVAADTAAPAPAGPGFAFRERTDPTVARRPAAIPARTGEAQEERAPAIAGADFERADTDGLSSGAAKLDDLAGALGKALPQQFFTQLEPGKAVRASAPVQQVLTFVADDQATLASRVVGVANSNGLQPALALDGAAGKGAMELYLSVPVERYGDVLRQLSDLAAPQRQNLANTEDAKGTFFAEALKDYGVYQDVRRSETEARGRVASEVTSRRLRDGRAGGEAMYAEVRELPRSAVAEGERDMMALAAAQEVEPEPTGELNLIVRVVPPVEAARAGR